MKNISGGVLQNLNISLSGISPNTFGLAGGQVANQYIGVLNPNASDVVYWYVSYPCSHNTIGNFTATVSDNTAGTVSFSTNITTKSSISANAGGLISTQLWGAGAVVGQIIYTDVTYSFGNANVGDEYNMQPAGNLTFDAATFQLSNVEVISSVIPKINVGSKDTLYYIGGSKSGSSNLVKMRYYFEVKKSNSPGTLARPYAVQTSGTQIKYTGNYASFSPSTTPVTGVFPFVLSLKANKDNALPCDTIIYRVVIKNNSSYPASIDEIKAYIPPSISYVGLANGSQVTLSKMMAYPSVGSTGCLRWIGGKPSSVFPYKDFYVAGNDSIILLFKGLVSCLVPANTPTNSSAVSFAGVDSSNAAQKGICLNCVSNFPVELTYFDANQENSEEIVVRWQTASEKNNNYFEIEHAVDGKSFTGIGIVEGAGSSNEIHNYSFSHNNIAIGTNYYRLKQVDIDGEINYTETKMVYNHSDILLKSNIYPNPVSDKLTLDVSVAKPTDVRIEIYNLYGQLVYRNVEAVETLKTTEVMVGSWAKGTYFIKVIPLKNAEMLQTDILEVE